MTAIEATMNFLVWPKGNDDWERDIKRLQPYAEELWNRVLAAWPENSTKKCQVYTVAGLLDGDGATTTAASLAYYMAQEMGQRVLLVEADLRNPSLHDLGMCPRSPGLAGVMQRESRLKNVIFDVARLGIHVLPAGKSVTSPTTQINATKLRGLLASVEPFFDAVLFDGPPFTLAPETRYLVQVSDATIPVVRSGTAVPEQAAYWIAKISEFRGRVGAVCLSGVETVLPTKVRALL